MLKSSRGKDTSEWSSWILAYEHTLRVRYTDLFVNRLDLDLHVLRLRFEAGDNPIELAKQDFIPLLSAQAKVHLALERQRVLDDASNARSMRIGKRATQLCLIVGLIVAGGFGYLSYSRWSHIWEMRNAEQARIEWRNSIGLK